MNRALLVLGMVVALCVAAPARATSSRSGLNMSVTTNHDGPIDDCRQVRLLIDENLLFFGGGGHLAFHPVATSGHTPNTGIVNIFEL